MTLTNVDADPFFGDVGSGITYRLAGWSGLVRAYAFAQPRLGG